MLLNLLPVAIADTERKANECEDAVPSDTSEVRRLVAVCLPSVIQESEVLLCKFSVYGYGLASFSTSNILVVPHTTGSA